MTLELVALSLSNFAEGRLAAAVDSGIADILERFRQAESEDDVELANDVGTITVKLSIKRDTNVGGFVCSFDEPALKLPKLVTRGTPAMVRDGVLVVATETLAGDQVRLITPSTPRQ